MGEVHFYSNKIKSLIILTILSLFMYALFSLDTSRYYVAGIIILNLFLITLIFGIIYCLILLLRIKPLLTVTNSQIIIYNLFGKSSVMNFDEIASFYISSATHRGIKTSEQIDIVLKYSEISLKKSIFFPNLSQSISVDILNVKAKVLLELLNNRLKDFKDKNVVYG